MRRGKLPRFEGLILLPIRCRFQPRLLAIRHAQEKVRVVGEYCFGGDVLLWRLRPRYVGSWCSVWRNGSWQSKCSCVLRPTSVSHRRCHTKSCVLALHSSNRAHVPDSRFELVAESRRTNDQGEVSFRLNLAKGDELEVQLVDGAGPIKTAVLYSEGEFQTVKSIVLSQQNS